MVGDDESATAVPITLTRARSSRRARRRDDFSHVGVFGTNLGQSVAGLNSAERVNRDSAPKEAPKAAARRTRPDKPDEIVVSTETIDAVRNLKGNSQEEAHEDRQEHPAYTPGGRLTSDPASKRVDLEG